MTEPDFACYECGSKTIEAYSPYTHKCLYCGLKHCCTVDAEWTYRLPPILLSMLLATLYNDASCAEDAVKYCFGVKE